MLTTEVTLPNENGDFIPPMPNMTLNNSTLAGVDIEMDGVRDDMELLLITKI